MSSTSGETDAPKNRGGRPRAKVTPEMVSAARHWLGRLVYPARVAARVARKFDVSRAVAYRAIRQAQEELRRELAGEGADPATAAYAGLVAVAANPKASERERVAAWNGVVRLLGVRAVSALADDAAALRLLHEIAERKANRPATPKTPNEGTQ